MTQYYETDLAPGSFLQTLKEAVDAYRAEFGTFGKVFFAPYNFKSKKDHFFLYRRRFFFSVLVVGLRGRLIANDRGARVKVWYSLSHLTSVLLGLPVLVSAVVMFEIVAGLGPGYSALALPGTGLAAALVFYLLRRITFLVLLRLNPGLLAFFKSRASSHIRAIAPSGPAGSG